MTGSEPGRASTGTRSIVYFTRDPDDDHVIATALAVGADYIVTGDRDLLALGRHETVRIVTARAFLDELAC